MQIRSLSLKLLTPFNSIKLFQFMVTIETQGAFDCMGNPDVCLKSGFQIWQSNAKCKTDVTPPPPLPFPPRNPFPNHDFMDFLYTVLVGKTVLVNSVFFLLVMCAHARQLFSQKQFKSFLVISPKYCDYQRSNFTCIATTQTSNTIR